MAKILIIEDDEMLRSVIARTLRGAGHDPVEAGDGRRGMELAQALSPVLVITNINMPVQEGIQTIRELKELDPAPLIIVISGESRRGYYGPLEDARLLGADVALAKPFTLDALLAEVRKLLEWGAGGATAGEAPLTRG